MTKQEISKIAKELIEQAKQLSKEKFLEFSKNIFDIDEDVWEHLWQVPIVSNKDTEAIFPINISTMDKDELEKTIKTCVKSELGKSDAVYIPMDNFICELTPEAMEEYDKGLAQGSIDEPYSAVIVYKEQVLIDEFEELLQLAKTHNPPRTIEFVKERYLEMIAKTFTHERVHLNVESMLIAVNEKVKTEDYFSEKVKDVKEVVNGIQEKDDDYVNTDNNEVVVDVMAQMMHKYENGDNIEDCFYKVMQARGETSMYDDIDDREVLAIYAINPEEIAGWTMLGAYTHKRKNPFVSKQKAIFGVKSNLGIEEKLGKIGEYFNQNVSCKLSEEQFAKRKEIFELIGIDNIELKQARRISKEEIKEVATSEIAMEQYDAASLKFVKNRTILNVLGEEQGDRDEK